MTDGANARMSWTDDAVREAVLQILQHGLIRRDGAVVGCWWVDSATRTRGLACRAMTRTADGRAIGTTIELPLEELFELAVADDLRVRESDPDVDGASFGHVLRKAVAMVDPSPGTARDGVDTLPSETLRVLASRILGRHAAGGFVDAARDEAMARVHRDQRTFLATLDPEALGILATRTFADPKVGWTAFGSDAEHMLVGRLGQVWHMLDATFGHGAPLKAALGRHPGLLDTLVAVARGSRDDEASFRSDVEGGRLADRIARRAHARMRVPHAIGMRLADLSAALDRDPARAEAIRVRMRERRGGLEHGERSDVAVSVARDADALPIDAVPHDVASWDAFLDCHGVICAASSLLGPYYEKVIPHQLLNLGSGWASFRARALEATRGAAVDDAATDAGDLGRAFLDEVVHPAMAIVDRLGPAARLERWGMHHVAGGSMLFSGRSLGSVSVTFS